jgi:hypothetical protein
VFKLDNIDIPEQWTQLAIDILAQKYFRKAGIPQTGSDGKPLTGPDGKPAGIPPAGRLLDALGENVRLFQHQGGRRRFLR